MKSAFTFNYSGEDGNYNVTGTYQEIQSQLAGFEIILVNFHKLKIDEEKFPPQKKIYIFKTGSIVRIGEMYHGKPFYKTDHFACYLKDYIIANHTSRECK